MGMVHPFLDHADNEDLIICPALTTTQNRHYTVLIINFLQQPYTLRNGFHIAIFSILTPKQAKYIKPVKPTTLRHLLNKNHDDAIQYLNTFLKMPQSEDSNET